MPAGDVNDPERTIPRSTVLGIGIAALLYVLGTVAVMGVVPREVLVKSLAPFSDAAQILWGQGGATVISLAVILSSIGALNGWTLLMGQVPMAAAQDGLFPAVPLSPTCSATGIIVSAILATVLAIVQAAGSSGFSTFYPLVVGPRHDGGRHSLRLLCAGDGSRSRGPCQRRRTDAKGDASRADRFRVRDVHAVRLRRGAGPRRPGAASARNSRIHLTMDTRG